MASPVCKGCSYYQPKHPLLIGRECAAFTTCTEDDSCGARSPSLQKAGSIAAAEELSPTIKGCPSGLNTAPSVVYPYTAGTLRARTDAMRVPQAGSKDLLVCHQTACGTQDATGMRHTGGKKNEADLSVCHTKGL